MTDGRRKLLTLSFGDLRLENFLQLSVGTSVGNGSPVIDKLHVRHQRVAPPLTQPLTGLVDPQDSQGFAGPACRAGIHAFAHHDRTVSHKAEEEVGVLFIGLDEVSRVVGPNLPGVFSVAAGVGVAAVAKQVAPFKGQLAVIFARLEVLDPAGARATRGAPLSGKLPPQDSP